jgi:hypothetical protein
MAHAPQVTGARSGAQSPLPAQKIATGAAKLELIEIVIRQGAKRDKKDWAVLAAPWRGI